MWDKLKELKERAVECVLWAENELGGKTGAEKKNAVVEKLDGMIKLPFFLEWADNWIIGWVVDFVCDAINRLTGKKFAGEKLDEAHTAKLAAVLDAPVSAMEAEADKPGLTLEQRIDELYGQYGIKKLGIRNEELGISMTPNGKNKEQLTPHFARSEFACKCGCGFDDVDPVLVGLCESIRVKLGMPVRVNSGCRCVKHNKNVGSKVMNSYHTLGKAVDLSAACGPKKLFETVKKMYEAGELPGLEYCEEYAWGVHIDTGKKRKSRFAPRG